MRRLSVQNPRTENINQQAQHNDGDADELQAIEPFTQYQGGAGESHNRHKQRKRRHSPGFMAG